MFRTSLKLLSPKLSTGLVNVPVVPNAKEVLIDLYNRCLNDLKQFPNDAAYRINTEKIVKYRLDIVTKANSVEELENEIDCGQAEELIHQAQDELTLIPVLIEAKCWERAPL